MAQGIDGLVPDGQLGQVGQQLQIGVGLHALGGGELGDIPQVVGVYGPAFGQSGLGPDGGLHGLVGEGHFLNDTGDGIAQHGDGADQAVFIHGNGVNGGLAGRQGDGVGIEGTLGGGVFPVQGVEDILAVQRGQPEADILAVIALGLVRGGGSGPQGLQLVLHIGFGQAFHKLHRVQQLVLLHEAAAQGGVQLRGGVCLDGFGKGHLGLGKVAVVLILVGQLHGHTFVLIGKFVRGVIKHGGQPGVAVQILIPGLT